MSDGLRSGAVWRLSKRVDRAGSMHRHLSARRPACVPATHIEDDRPDHQRCTSAGQGSGVAHAGLLGAIADNLVHHRRPAVVVGLRALRDYLEHQGVPSEPARQRRILMRATGLQIILAKVRPITSHGRGPSSTRSESLLRFDPVVAVYGRNPYPRRGKVCVSAVCPGRQSGAPWVVQIGERR